MKVKLKSLLFFEEWKKQINIIEDKIKKLGKIEGIPEYKREAVQLDFV